MKNVITENGSHEVREGDVFHAYFKDRNKDRHCFEGLLVAKDNGGGIALYDTFWSPFGGNGGKVFELETANISLDLIFYRNLNDYDLKQSVKYPQGSYLEHDFIFLHDQHACHNSCKYFYLRKGAKKSKVIMLHNLNRKLEEKTRLLTSSIPWDIECIKKDIQRVHDGEEVYI